MTTEVRASVALFARILGTMLALVAVGVVVALV